MFWYVFTIVIHFMQFPHMNYHPMGCLETFGNHLTRQTTCWPSKFDDWNLKTKKTNHGPFDTILNPNDTTQVFPSMSTKNSGENWRKHDRDWKHEMWRDAKDMCPLLVTLLPLTALFVTLLRHPDFPGHGWGCGSSWKFWFLIPFVYLQVRNLFVKILLRLWSTHDLPTEKAPLFHRELVFLEVFS